MPRPCRPASLSAPRGRRLLKTPAAASSSSCSAASGRRGGPGTPKLRWGARGVEEEEEENAGEVRAPGASSSVRRLAAAVWRLRPPEEAPAAAGGATAPAGLEHIPRHLQVQLLRNNHLGHQHALKIETSSPSSVLERHSGELDKVQLHLASAILPITSLENATKWESKRGKEVELDDAYVIASQLNLIDKQGECHADSLQIELQQAQDRVGQLEAERLSAKKQLDRLFEKLKEEKAAWRRREHKKVNSILEDMKADLEHEKKNRRQLETINLKLVDELKEVKMAANNLLQEYDNERKTRELTEEICNKLVREVEEHNSEIETLKQNSLKLREELDEDRKLLQMAEVWREERVQMKLVDARLTLEAKYDQLSKMQQDVETLIASFGCAKGESTIVQEAENIIRTIGSVREQEVEFKYDPPAASEDILSVFEELRPSKELEKQETEPCCKQHSTSVHLSEIEVSPMADMFLENPSKRYPNRSPYDCSETEDGSSWETTSHEDLQGSSFSQNGNGSEPSVNKICDRISWTSRNDSEDGQNDLTNVYLTDMKQPKKKLSAISKLWRSSPLKTRETCEEDAGEPINVRSSNGRLSNGGMYHATEGANRSVALNSPSMERWSSPGSKTNSQLNRGFKGCMELVQRQGLKAKLLEARLQSQKIQLRQVLNQRT